MTYRNKKLLESARGEACSFCGVDNGTTVWAHCNSMIAGKGIGEKAHDLIGAYLCSVCHDIYDGRSGTLLNREQKQEMFKEAFFRTMIRVAAKLEAGVLKL